MQLVTKPGTHFSTCDIDKDQGRQTAVWAKIGLAQARGRMEDNVANARKWPVQIPSRPAVAFLGVYASDALAHEMPRIKC